VFDVRQVRDQDEFGRALYGIGQYFGAAPTEEQLERFLTVLPLDRMHAAFDGEQIVGGAGAFPFQLSVPGGGSLGCGGVTVVGVYPTHRRRGALRALMDAQLFDIHERGEPLAALWASEETIYGRFGYGLAAWMGECKLAREWNAYARPFERRGHVRFVEPEEAAKVFPPVWEALMRERPGVPSRNEAWWKRRLRMPDEEKANPRRFVALELDGAVEAFAIYRQFPSWADGATTARLEVSEAVGANAHATAEIWRFLLDIDWYATLELELVPLDHPLFLLLANPRRLRYRMGDSLWVRLVDVGAALSGRVYGGDGSIVFEVRDAVCPWNDGRWKLSDGAAARTDEAAELVLEVDALGSAYLGAVSFAQLAAAGRLGELVDGAVARADALFAWRPLPWCPEIF
jgi:predicted acetyltransferase